MENEHNYTEVGKWNDRLEMLGYDIVALIGNGKTENVTEIIEHFGNEDVVHYLMKKSQDEMYIINKDCPYNLDDWEKVLGQYSYMTFRHDVRRKMSLL